MQRKVGQPLGDCQPGAGQKTRTNAIGGGAEAEVEAGGLDLIGRKGRRDDAAFRCERRDCL